MLLQRIGRALDAALGAAVSSWRGSDPSPDQIADYTIRSVPEWRQDLTPPEERDRLRREGRESARESMALRTEVRVIARDHGINLG
jgi:hypothetical protein